MATADTFSDFAMGVLLPLCRDRFLDSPNGGFHEQLHPNGANAFVGGKRLMVQCRQLYVLAHAAELGDRSGEAAARDGYRFLQRAYADPVQGGWFFRATPEGEPTDRTKDCYTHAFVLFALAYLHRAFKLPGALDLAHATFATVQERLAAPGGGFWDAATEDWQPVRGTRRQNPHMHLLEAFHALYEASGDPRWLTEAEALVVLFRERFFDARTATLGEVFGDDWTPHTEHGHIIEAGHHFEWVWLLHRHALLRGEAVDPAANALFETAVRHGFDSEHGGLHNQIDRAGSPLDRARRVWTIAEAIKAYVARIEAGLPVPEGEPERLIGHLFECFIRPAQLGWLERLTREGEPLQTTLPGSTPYHLFLAAAESKRVLSSAIGRFRG